MLPPRGGGSGRGSHCTTCSVSPGCALQEALPGQSRTSDLCETPQMPGTEASASTPGTRDSNALLQLPKPHTNPQGLAAGTPGPHQKPPPLCTQGTCAGGADVLSPSSGCSLMDLGDLKLSELPTSASAPGKRTPALPFSLGLCSGAPAPPAQCCSDNFSEWMLLQKRWPPSLDCFGCSMAGAGSTLTAPALN